ncbi:MAG: hypothetical protein ACHQZS_10975 [Candidatus Binatales bacterium]
MLEHGFALLLVEKATVAAPEVAECALKGLGNHERLALDTILIITQIVVIALLRRQNPPNPPPSQPPSKPNDDEPDNKKSGKRPA